MIRFSGQFRTLHFRGAQGTVTMVDFSSENGDLPRCRNPDLDRVTIDPNDFDINLVTDDNALINFSRKN